MMYSIKEHGDLLEKEAATFIADKLNNYEEVWNIYIGNTGNAKMATLPNYSDEDKRINFAENIYTMLESAFMIHRILGSNVFETPINIFDDYVKFNNAFISFFAHLGRMRDTILKVSDCLLPDNREFKAKIQPFYKARCITIHGKKIPLKLDELSLPQIPAIKTTLIKGDGWDDRINTWSDALTMDMIYIQDGVQKYFDDFLILINNQYGELKNEICRELKAIPTQLIFEYNPTQFLNTKEHIIMPSGCGSISNFDPLEASKYLQ